MLLAIVAAGGAAFMVRNIIANNQAASTETIVYQEKEIATEEVLVAIEDMPMGRTAVEEDFKWQEWPKGLVPERYLTREKSPDARSEMAGGVVRSPIMAGEPVQVNKLVRLGDSSMMALLIRKGMRAVSIRVSPETTAGGFILPGDRVDVIMTRQIDSLDADERPGNDPDAARTAEGSGVQSETVLANVKILAVDQQVSQATNEEGVSAPALKARTVTVELSPEHVELMALAEEVGSLSLALRSFQETLKADGTPDESSRPIAVGRLGVVNVADEMNVASKKAAPRKKRRTAGTMKLILGGTIAVTKAEMAPK